MQGEHNANGAAAEEQPPNPLKQAALEYVARGWHVIHLYWITDAGVCACGRGHECESPGKHPIANRGLDDALTDPNDVDYFWDRFPRANVGIVCGPSGLAVVDIDTENARAVVGEHVDLKKVTDGCPIVQTSRGHHIFYSDDGTNKPRVGKGQRAGIDLRAGQSYVVAPPSRHISGHIYTWVRE